MAKNLVNGTNIKVEEENNDVHLELTDEFYTAMDDRIINNNVYSTTETVIGTWTNGKPIYRKVFTGDISSITITTGLTNVSVVNAYGVVEASSGAILPLPSLRPLNSAFSIGFYISNSNNIVFEKGNSASGTAYVTLEYTKTTD